MKIAIIGSGISGLAAAAFLLKDGHDVQLLERFEEPEPIGSGLLLQPTGLACLACLDLDKQIIDLGAPVLHLNGESVYGKNIFDISYNDLAPHIFGLGIHRGSLFSVLYNKVKKQSVPIRTECKITEYHSRNYEQLLIDQNGDTHGPFDLVIDASGINSILRNKYGSIKLSKTYPYGALWGICEDPNQKFAKNVLQQRYDRASTMIGILPVGKHPDKKGEHITFFWSLPTNSYEEWKANGLESWKQNVLEHWPEIDIFTNQINTIDDLTFAEYGDVVMQKWYNDSLVFIGEAAHCMSPQLGQGANLGIIDAMILSNCLREKSSIRNALTSYNKLRRKHIRFYQAASRLLTPFFQSDNTLAAWFRDLTFGPMCKTPYLKTEMIKTLSGMKNGIFSYINPGIWHKDYDLKK